MLISPRPKSTAADLLRLLAAWLVAILLVQGFGAALALGAGPLHQHRQRGSAQAHTHAHATHERHHHAADDRSVVADADIAEALEAASAALACALALIAPSSASPWADDRRHDRPATEPPRPHGTHPEAPLHPPRLA